MICILLYRSQLRNGAGDVDDLKQMAEKWESQATQALAKQRQLEDQVLALTQQSQEARVCAMLAVVFFAE